MHCTTFRPRNRVTTLRRASYTCTWYSQPSGIWHCCFVHERSRAHVSTVRYYTVHNASRQIPSLYLNLGQAAIQLHPIQRCNLSTAFCYSDINPWDKLGFQLEQLPRTDGYWIYNILTCIHGPTVYWGWRNLKNLTIYACKGTNLTYCSNSVCSITILYVGARHGVQATSRKVAGSIPDGVIGIFHWHKSFWPHYGPGVDSASKRNECLGVKTAGA
jgi:hypothetical protein